MRLTKKLGVKKTKTMNNEKQEQLINIFAELARAVDRLGFAETESGTKGIFEYMDMILNDNLPHLSDLSMLGDIASANENIADAINNLAKAIREHNS